MSTSAGLIVVYVFTVLIFLGYVGGSIYFILELRVNRNSLVLNKRRTYPLVILSLICGSLWILIYFIPITLKLFQLNSAGAEVLFIVLQTLIEFAWIYSLLLRVHIAYWDMKITQTREQCQWYQLIDDQLPKSIYLKYENTYGNINYVAPRVLILVIASGVLSMPAVLLPSSVSILYFFLQYLYTLYCM